MFIASAPDMIEKLSSFCKRVSLKLWQPSKHKLKNASPMLMSSPKAKPTLIK